MPYYIAGCSTHVYVWDGYVDAVRKYDALGSPVAEWRVPLTFPPYHEDITGMAVAPDGSLYLVDSTAKKVYVFDSQGCIVRQWGKAGAGPGEFSQPAYVAVDNLGHVYVGGSNCVQEFGSTGEYLRQYPSENPSAIAANDGVVLVGERSSGKLMKFDTSGAFLGSWTAADPGHYGFRPWSVCIDANGNPRVVDSLNDRVYSLTCAATAVRKTRPDGAFVYLKSVTVTAGSEELGDCFYVESPDRSSGIKVTGLPAARGETVTLAGILTTRNGEREIALTSLTHGSKAADIKAVGMSLTGVGGGPCGIQSAPWAWRWAYDPVLRRSEYKWTQLSGMSNIGLLVRTWGRVDSASAATNTFVITDGNKQYLKCSVPITVQLPQTGRLVCLTGVSSTELNDKGDLVALLRLRSQSDLSVLYN